LQQAVKEKVSHDHKLPALQPYVWSYFPVFKVESSIIEVVNEQKFFHTFYFKLRHYSFTSQG